MCRPTMEKKGKRSFKPSNGCEALDAKLHTVHANLISSFSSLGFFLVKLWAWFYFIFPSDIPDEWDFVGGIEWGIKASHGNRAHPTRMWRRKSWAQGDYYYYASSFSHSTYSAPLAVTFLLKCALVLDCQEEDNGQNMHMYKHVHFKMAL